MDNNGQGNLMIYFEYIQDQARSEQINLDIKSEISTIKQILTHKNSK